MAITSVNNKLQKPRFVSAQFYYAILYVLITFIVLLVLNIYCSKISQKLFYSSKESLMVEICNMTASNIAQLEVMNSSTVSSVISDLGEMERTRIIVTDQNSQAVYDSQNNISVEGQYILFPPIIKALSGYDVFIWKYQSGSMHSYAATPVFSYGKLIGCVYMMEDDPDQGALIASLQGNILTITLLLEVAVILFSFVFSNTYSRRLKKIMNSIRNVRDGDYSHKIQLPGRDELNALGNEFNDLISRLRISENKRHQFVSDASHELKTPLASIKLLSDSILQNTMDQETVREFVGDIGNEADRLNRMSQKLLSLSRIDSEETASHEIANIAPTIERVVRMLSVNADERGISVVLNITQDSPILVLEDDLYQIIFNLVENGIKYNRDQGTLTISLSQKDDNAIITVEDTGVGIPEDSLGHIFERFYRVDKARSRKTGGSGLGLSIVRNIVKRNNGTIHVESAMGKGTKFTLSFPIFDIEEEQE